MTDPDQKMTYAAEHQVCRLMDTAVEVEDWFIDFHGYRMELPQERKFADLASIQRYYEQVVQLDKVQERFPGIVAPKVRERATMDHAHYSPLEQAVYIPMKWNGRWAQRELVVLHELAHHFTPVMCESHGAEFRGAYVFLVQAAMGQSMALVLGEQMVEQVGKPWRLVGLQPC